MHYNVQGTEYHFGGPRITWAVQRLIIANALVFALQLIWSPIEILLLARTGGSGPLYPGGFTHFLAFQPDLFLRGFVYKPLTYQFLHSGLMHLFMNMLWLFFFGPDVERALGTRQFFRFYLLCGAVAVFATLIPYLLPFASAPTVTGASGAVMAVLMAFALVEPDRQFYLFPLPMPITARALVLIVVVMNIITGLGRNNEVSVETHFGGLLAGYVYIRMAPWINSWQRNRHSRKTRPQSDSPNDKLGEAVDNIFKFEDRHRR